uniref:Dynein heavy chain 3 AAA+ lid domain-containing protein n=1 Tax=Clytia hemisphaerica TaxID=252671 RepID=A0A7M5WQG1_9CNID
GVIRCGHFCKERGFTDEVRTLANDLVACTRRLWQYTKVKMLPTPAKFHYVFNLRDLSRIWQGMLNAVSDVITETSTLLSQWQHECTRVICDRFVNEMDKSWFRKVAVQICDEEIGASHDLSCLEEEAYFVDFLRDAPEPTGDEPDDADFEAPKIYEPVTILEPFSKHMTRN